MEQLENSNKIQAIDVEMKTCKSSFEHEMKNEWQSKLFICHLKIMK